MKLRDLVAPWIEKAAKVCDELASVARPICEANHTDGDSWIETCASEVRDLLDDIPDEAVGVPHDPTDRMIEAGEVAYLTCVYPEASNLASTRAGRLAVTNIYRAMLSAAPSPQSSEESKDA